MTTSASQAGANLRVEPWTGADAEWDAFVDTREEATFCHLAGWRHIMGDVLGHTSHDLAVRDDEGTVVGVLPIVEVRSLIFGHYLVSMPFLNYGGPLGPDDARAALSRAAREIAEDLGVELLELRSRQEVPGDLATSHRKITVVLDLPDDPEVLWKDLKSKVRSQVRRPRKADMEARVGHDQVDAFYEVFCVNMRDLGTPVLSRRLFDALVDTFPDNVVFAAVYAKDGTPVAGGCGFRHGSEYEMTWASSLREYNRQAPNMLLYWACMEHAIEEGLGHFNFGRCTPDSGTHRFKSQWGGDDVPLPWAQWAPKGKAATPNPDGGVFELATRVWQKLPLGVANRIGPLLSRQIP